MSTEGLKYTNHAFERMTERDITRPMVEAVVNCGVLDRIQERGVKRYRLEGLVVVVDGQDVVTVYFDSDARQRGRWSTKKKQRRCRPGEMKPHYFEGRGKVNVRLHAHYMRQMEG